MGINLLIKEGQPQRDKRALCAKVVGWEKCLEVNEILVGQAFYWWN